MRSVLAAICLLAATACDENSPIGPTVPLNERFTLAPGEVADVEQAAIRVQFLKVTGDSRCPADAVCLQGGDAVVHTRVHDAEGRTDYELHTGDSRRAAAVHRDVTIELVELQPYPFSSRTIDPSEYRATLVVRR
jgi:hypothetical protein